MSNIVTLAPRRAQTQADRLDRMTQLFARQRRGPDDVFWLKENAEWLGILASGDMTISARALTGFEAFYGRIEERMRFFPQYYRFLLSLCLDLEALGMPGAKGAALCDFVAKAGLAAAELSDLQRAEARRLLARRGHMTEDTGLTGRLHGFIDQPATFAIPNKKAAYELTHIVFYLSHYGRRDPEISDAALTSLHHAGVLAWLDQNIDLLAEVCAALRFAGVVPSHSWEQAVQSAHAAFRISSGGRWGDGYHECLVTGWATAIAGGHAFGADVPEAAATIARPATAPGPLRHMSQALYELGHHRSADWSAMRARLVPQLDEAAADILMHAERSVPDFESFFSEFARARGAHAPVLATA
jgi:hypothetical protein